MNKTNKKFLYHANLENAAALYREKRALDTPAQRRALKKDIQKIYQDPDSRDPMLYAALAKKYGLRQAGCHLLDDSVLLSVDCVTGWKELFDLREGKPCWLRDYEILRKSLVAHLVWPCHPLPTINTLRRSVFHDRIDDTLLDIACFYSCLTPGLSIRECKAQILKKCRLHKAYLNEKGNTFAWLAKMERFENFIEKMRLQRFTDAQYRVIDIEDMKSPLTGRAESRAFTKSYWRHLAALFTDQADR